MLALWNRTRSDAPGARETRVLRDTEAVIARHVAIPADYWNETTVNSVVCAHTGKGVVDAVRSISYHIGIHTYADQIALLANIIIHDIRVIRIAMTAVSSAQCGTMHTAQFLFANQHALPPHILATGDVHAHLSFMWDALCVDLDTCALSENLIRAYAAKWSLSIKTLIASSVTKHLRACVYIASAGMVEHVRASTSELDNPRQIADAYKWMKRWCTKLLLGHYSPGDQICTHQRMQTAAFSCVLRDVSVSAGEGYMFNELPIAAHLVTNGRIVERLVAITNHRDTVTEWASSAKAKIMWAAFTLREDGHMRIQGINKLKLCEQLGCYAWLMVLINAHRSDTRDAVVKLIESCTPSPLYLCNAVNAQDIRMAFNVLARIGLAALGRLSDMKRVQVSTVADMVIACCLATAADRSQVGARSVITDRVNRLAAHMCSAEIMVPHRSSTP